MLHKVQNQCARLVMKNFDREVHGEVLVSNLGWQNVRQRIAYFTDTLTYKCLNDMAPNYRHDRFTYLTELHDYDTHNSNQLEIPKARTNNLTKTFSYQGAKNWNSLPITIKESESLAEFKRLLKCHLKGANDT